MKLSADTRIHDLLATHPFLERFLAELHPKFELLRSRMARATVGRVATVRAAAEIAGLDTEELVGSLAAEIERRTGARPELEDGTRADLAAGGRAESSTLTSSGSNAGTTPAARSRDERLGILREIISDVHAGGDLERAQKRFAEAVADVEASEIAAMEEDLIRSGLPVSEVQRLCDVHVGAFRPALDAHAEVSALPGHPIHTYQADNREITRLADALGRLARRARSASDLTPLRAQIEALLDELAGIENHYQRKENQLFPLLERHDVSGPTKVMWGVHDEIRGQLKQVRAALKADDADEFAQQAVRLGRALVEMVYKEEKILLPLALETLSPEEWSEVRSGEDQLGYVLADPGDEWPQTARPSTSDVRSSSSAACSSSSADRSSSSAPRSSATTARKGDPVSDDRLELATGSLSPDQMRLLFTHLPVDVTFVDETDTVRFYSEGPDRVFPRTPAVIGRKVQNCHPPKSVDVVERIVTAFREGRRDTAEFWIEMKGRFIHIRYFALRDDAGAYRGVIEVTQDVTEIRALEGQRRLLDWNV
ncbi:MAG: DUF438 domain-containing protein [Candidatus Eisenbacteria bacterium]|nr:DUF438 domain-containing protein [Candidatus Eisenbacteria bacterium]